MANENRGSARRKKRIELEGDDFEVENADQVVSRRKARVFEGAEPESKAERRARREAEREGRELQETLAIKPSHGIGRLRQGNPGNVGNRLGAVPSHIRARMRGSYADRLEILENIIDGAATERTAVSLADVLKFAHCPRCKAALKPSKNGHKYVVIEGRRSAKVNERLAALDQLAKYGLGTTREISTEEVKQRLVSTIETIQALLNPVDADRVIRALKPIWTTS